MQQNNNNQETFAMAIENCDANTIASLLKDPDFDPTFNDNEAFIRMCELTRVCSETITKKVFKLLLNDKRINPATQNQKGLYYLYMPTYGDVIMHCIKDPRVDPTLHGNKLFVNACKWGMVEIVKYLLQNPGIDPTANNYSAIQAMNLYPTSFSDNVLEVLMILLEDTRVNPYRALAYITFKCRGFNSVHVLKRMLKSPRFGAPNNDLYKKLYNKALNNCIFEKQPESVELLLAYEHAPCLSYDLVLCDALLSDRKSMIPILMKNKSIWKSVLDFVNTNDNQLELHYAWDNDYREDDLLDRNWN